MELKPGRNWYEITWFSPDTFHGLTPIETALHFSDVPQTIDVLAVNKSQAIDIAKSAYMVLQHATDIFANLRGCERDFQRQREPHGEENIDLLPY